MSDNLYQQLRDSGEDVDHMHVDTLRLEVRKLRAKLKLAKDALREAPVPYAKLPEVLDSEYRHWYESGPRAKALEE